MIFYRVLTAFIIFWMGHASLAIDEITHPKIDLLNAITFSPDGTTLVLSTSSGMWFYNWDDMQNDPQYLQAHHWEGQSVGYDTTGRYLRTHNQDSMKIDYIMSMERLWDIVGGIDNPRLLAERTASQFDRTGQVITADQQHIYDYDNALLWNTRTDQPRPLIFPSERPFNPIYNTLYYDEEREIFLIKYGCEICHPQIVIFDARSLEQRMTLRFDGFFLWDFQVANQHLIFTGQHFDHPETRLYGITLDDLLDLGDDFLPDNAEILWHRDNIHSEPIQTLLHRALFACTHPLCQTIRPDNQSERPLEINMIYAVHPQTGDVIHVIETVDDETPYIILHNLSQDQDMYRIHQLVTDYAIYWRLSERQ